MTSLGVHRLRVPGPHALAGVLVVGVAARAVLIPITHGPDFAVWDLASRATLDGVNVYAHHPAYSGGPYTYFPLFLYMELPMQWLARHTGVPFTVLGKLPIAGADLAVTLLIVHELRRRGVGERTHALAAGLFFLNPLVLYNGSFYGRFDSVCLALLMLSLAAYRPERPLGWRFAVSFALAVAAKTFPVFLLPWVCRRGLPGATRVAVATGVILAALSAPYLLGSPAAFVSDLLYGAGKLPGSLSWQVLFHGLPAALQVDLGDVLLGAFVVGAIAIASVEDLTVAAAATTVLFLLLSKEVIEQYLTWPLPFLVLLAVARGSRPAWWLVVGLTATGMVVNAYFHPLGLQPAALNVVFAAAGAVALARLLATERSRLALEELGDARPPAAAGSTLALPAARS